MRGFIRLVSCSVGLLATLGCGSPATDSMEVGRITSQDRMQNSLSLVDRLRLTSRLLETMSRGRDGDEQMASLHALHGRYIGQFWAAWQAAVSAQAAKSPAHGASTTDFKAQAQTAEMDLLGDMFSDPMPAQARTLLYVLGDTLASLVDRFAASTALYDFSCKLTGCHQGHDGSEFTELVALIAAIPDGATLRRLLAADHGRAVRHVRPAWRATFSALADPARHQVLEQAVLTATGRQTYTPDLMTRRLDVPPAMGTLTPVLLRCQRWRDNFGLSGYFENDSFSRLKVPLDHEKLSQWVQEVARQRGELAAELARFTEDRRAGLAASQQGSQYEKEQVVVATRLKQTRLQIGQLATELHAIRADITRTEMGQTFAQDLEGLLEQGNVDTRTGLQVGPSFQVGVAAEHARAGRSGDLASWAVPAEVMSPSKVEGGDVLSISATGMWSPTCALQKAGRLAATNAHVGPEGFDQQIVDGSVQTSAVHTSRDVSTSLTSTVSAEQAMEAFAQAGGSFFGNEAGIRVSTRMSQRVDVAGQSAMRRSDYDVAAAEKRTSAAFSVGLRLPNTPFPTFPAGSLLFIQAPNDAHLEPVIEVVRPQMSLIALRAATAYFVVNDLAPGCTPNPGYLDVRVRVTQTVSGAAKSLSKAITTVLGDLDTRLAATANSPVSPMAAASLRSEVHTLLNRRGVRLEELPPEMSNLFYAFLDKAIANWERKAILVNKQREMEAFLLEEQALTVETQLTEGQQRLNVLAMLWAEKNADVEALRWRTARLIRLTSDTLVPALHILYPERMREYRQQIQPLASHLATLRKVPFEQDFSVLVRSALEIVATCEADLRASEAISRTRGRLGVALVFDRPMRGTAFGAPRADAARSAAFWDAVERGSDVTVTIRPSDLYSANFDAPESLRCSHCAPIVRFMGGYFVLPAGATDPRVFNASSHPLPLVVNSDVLFATAWAPSRYTFSGASLTIPIKMGDDTMARSESVWFGAPGRGVNDALGLTPFSALMFNLQHGAAESSEFMRVLGDLTAFVLLLDVETQQCATDSLRWLQACQ